jgi:hypothetical protein
MNIRQFINEYGQHIESYKEYDNGVIFFRFAESDKIMWLKGVICEEMGMKVKTGEPGRYYFFEPVN